MATVRRLQPRGESSSPPRNQRLLELVRFGLCTKEKLAKASAEASRSGKSLGRVLLETGVLSEDNVREAVARWSGFEWINLSQHSADPDAIRLIPDRVARRYGVVALGFEGDRLVVAMSDPSNFLATDDLRILSGRELKVVGAARADIEDTLSRSAQQDKTAENLMRQATPVEQATKKAKVTTTKAAPDAPIVRAIDQVITQAVRRRASDIHVQPQEDTVLFRYRIDGVLHEVMKTPRGLLDALVSRLKVMSNLDIAEKRLPQDGRMTVVVDGRNIDLRVATFPSVRGEEVVMRILDTRASSLTLSDLGLETQAQQRLLGSLAKPYGTILVTGPTGSGKSTTLYASLGVLNDVSRNIITVEDPVEARIPGLRQIQVNNKAGLTFASALRSIVRADPDVIMVGEIRDKETASIAIQAALTGHLVLATLHTNDAPSALTRLVEMGIEPFLVASAVDAVVAQRLARTLCTRCRIGYKPSEPEIVLAGYHEDPPDQLFRPDGCAACSMTGYRGRTVLAEVMPVSQPIADLALVRGTSDSMREIALTEGMQTMRMDGLEKARRGITSLAEVIRVVV